MYANSLKTRTGQTNVSLSNKRQKLDPAAVRNNTDMKLITNNSNPTTRSNTFTKRKDNSNRITKSKLPEAAITQLRKRITDGTANKRSAIISKIEIKKEIITRNISSRPLNNKNAKGPSILNSVPIKSKLPSATNRNTNIPKKPQWNRNNTSSSLGRNLQSKENKSFQNIAPDSTAAIAIQTQEDEILNHSLIVGDIKFLNPSKQIVAEIEKSRKDLKNKQLLKAKRKFPEHSERQEEHLTDLNEFLEKSYVSKRKTPRKSRDTFDENQTLIQSMDQLLNREMPKTESIADIRARIKRKEEELLNLFDNVETTARLLINNGN